MCWRRTEKNIVDNDWVVKWQSIIYDGSWLNKNLNRSFCYITLFQWLDTRIGCTSI